MIIKRANEEKGLVVSDVLTILNRMDPNMPIIISVRGEGGIANNIRIGRYEFAHGYIEDNDYVGEPSEQVKSVIIIE